MKKKMKILFLCTGNSCRSQMAEGWARHLKGDVIEAWSAGIETHGLNPLATKVMAEAGVDISGHRSKNVTELADVKFDYVITVCDNAHESCPVFPGKTRVVHVAFDDPPRLAKNARTEAEALAHYRRVRDEIRAFVEALPESLGVAIHSAARQGRLAPPEEMQGRAKPPAEPNVKDHAAARQGRIAPPDEQTNLPKRKKLPHSIPSWVKQGARHFITINCRERGTNQLARPNIAQALFDSAVAYEKLGHWYLWLMAVMPDHIHFIATFNLQKGIRPTIKAWKSYQARQLGISFQSDFFEHRLRNAEEFVEKSCYIRMNPVRKGLVQTPEEWPFLIDRLRLCGDASPHPAEPNGRAKSPAEPNVKDDEAAR